MKCPCIDCISFAICNITIRRDKFPSVTNLMKYMKCDALYDFLETHAGSKNIVLNKWAMNETRKVYGLEEI